MTQRANNLERSEHIGILVESWAGKREFYRVPRSRTIRNLRHSENAFMNGASRDRPVMTKR